MNRMCVHQTQMREVTPRTADGCEECLKAGDGWVQLRLCLTCGHVGCCDASRNRHARLHFETTGHPVIESYRSGERWRWCYVDGITLPVPPLEDVVDPRKVAVGSGSASGSDTTSVPGPGTGGLLRHLLGALHRRNYLVGIIDDPGAASRGAHALEIYGFAAASVHLQSGSELARRMLQSEYGEVAREATLEEASFCAQYNERAREGMVLSVLTPTQDDVRRACHILTAYDAHSLMHFGDWTVSALRAEERCWR